ncbi:MAG: phosphonate ABC transporter, permease protein PhnE [bacterium]
MELPKPKRFYRSWWLPLALLAALIVYVFAWNLTEIDLYKLFTNMPKARHILLGLLRPNLDILWATLRDIVKTLFMALMATTIAIFIAIPVSFLGARNLMAVNPVGTGIYYIVRTILNILRSIEPLIMAIIFAVWVGIGPFAGVMALAVHSVASLGKLYSEQIESIDTGPIEAIMATGATRLQTIVYGVIPQIVPPYLAFTIYRWDINVRMSIIIGAVGGGGIGQPLFQYIGLLRWRSAGMVLWLVVTVVWLMDYASAKLREKII